MKPVPSQEADWQEVEKAWKEYNEADQLAHLKDQVREALYTKLSNGTAGLDDIAALAAQSDPYERAKVLARRFDELIESYGRKYLQAT